VHRRRRYAASRRRAARAAGASPSARECGLGRFLHGLYERASCEVTSRPRGFRAALAPLPGRARNPRWTRSIGVRKACEELGASGCSGDFANRRPSPLTYPHDHGRPERGQVSHSVAASISPTGESRDRSPDPSRRRRLAQVMLSCRAVREIPMSRTICWQAASTAAPVAGGQRAVHVRKCRSRAICASCPSANPV